MKTPTPETASFTNVTLYLAGGFGVNRIECRTLSVRVGRYAQYDVATHLTYVPKGKRKEVGTVLANNPWGLVVEGHGHLNPDSPFGSTVDRGDGVSSQCTRYSCFDSRYRTEFDASWMAYVAAKSPTVLRDFRPVGA